MTTFEKAILNNIPEGVILTENEIIQFTNPQLYQLLDITTNIVGEHISALTNYGISVPTVEECKCIRNYHTEVEITRIEHSPSQTGYIFRNIERTSTAALTKPTDQVIYQVARKSSKDATAETTYAQCKHWMNIFDVTSGLNAIIAEYDSNLEDLRVVVTSAGALSLLEVPKSESGIDSVGKYLLRDLHASEERTRDILNLCKPIIDNKVEVVRAEHWMNEMLIYSYYTFMDFSINKKPLFLIVSQDVTKITRLQRELEIFKRFVDEAPTFMGITELIQNNGHYDLKYVYTNPVTSNFFSRPTSNTATAMGMSQKTIDQLALHYLESKRSGKPVHHEIYFESPKLLWCWACVSHVSGDLWAFVWQDINSKKRYEEELHNNKLQLEELVKARTSQLEEALKVKSRFLATMSHEIRTPLSGVTGAITLLKDTNLNQEQHEYLHISEVCCGQLMAIINDILDFTKMETENMVLESVPFNLHTLLEDTMELISYNAEQKDIELILDVDQDVPRVIYSDPTRLRQIVVNLLSNAVKFSNGNGEVLLKCRKISKFDETCTLEFSVSDQGIGIPDSAKPFIYTPFVQADTSVTRKYGGSGLGLSISKKLTELMNGTMWFDSEEGKGSIFYFTMQAPVGEIKESDVKMTPRAGGSVALIMNSERYASVLSKRIQKLGYPVLYFRTVSEALEKLPESNVKIIMVDEKVVITNDLQTKLNSIGDMVVLQKTATSQPTDYLVLKKPIRSRNLESLLEKLSKQLTQSPPAYKSTPPRNIAPVESVHILVAEDNHMNQIIIKKLLRSLGFHSIDIVENGRDAVAAVLTKKYNVIFMDIMMPVMGGIEACERIQQLPESCQPNCIIALTADVFKENKEKCLKSGMIEVLNKPIERDELVRVLVKYVK